MLVALIGFRGTGKTTVAKHLALLLGWDWVDSDVEVELRAGKSIKAIFADDGESRFRDVEAAVLADLVTRNRLVIASGGGVVLRPVNRDLLRQLDCVVWLVASVDTILERLAQDPTTGDRRPGLTTLSDRAEIEHLLAEREPFYQQVADYQVDTADRSPREIAAEIAAHLNLAGRMRNQP